MSAVTVGRNDGQKPARRRFIYKTGLCEGTHVMTLEGNLPVEYLTAGDKVLTRQGAREIMHIAARPLTDCPVLIRRGSLGPARPAQDLYLAPDQDVHLRDWRARVIYGSDQVAVPVTRLRDGETILWGEHPGELLVYDLELAERAVIYAEGVEIMSATLPANAYAFAAE